MPRLLLLLLVVAGCGPGRPKAPPLTNEAVFQSEKAGVRLLPPDGWTLASRSDMPSGTLPRPVILVSYLAPGGAPAEFAVMAADVPAGANLGDYLNEHQMGSQKWGVQPPQAVTVGGAAGTRYPMTRGTGRNEQRREATAFPRGDGRVYYFVVTYPAADADRRDQSRRAVESVTWTK